MPRTSVEELLEAGVHFGHLKRKWDPAMAPYIFMEKNGVHIIDLNKTVVKLEEACNALAQIAKSGKKVLFVGTKKQAREIIADKVTKINQPFVTERWPGGMLTNFVTIRKAVKKMTNIEEMMQDGTIDTMSKKERLMLSRTKAKLEKDFGNIADMNRLPAAVFIVDIKKEHIAVAESRRLNIPTFAIVDTNSNPNEVDFPIPANDDATKSISLVLDIVCQAIVDGLKDRKADKDAAKEEETETAAKAAVVSEEKTEE